MFFSYLIFVLKWISFISQNISIQKVKSPFNGRRGRRLSQSIDIPTFSNLLGCLRYSVCNWVDIPRYKGDYLINNLLQCYFKSSWISHGRPFESHFSETCPTSLAPVSIIIPFGPLLSINRLPAYHWSLLPPSYRRLLFQALPRISQPLVPGISSHKGKAPSQLFFKEASQIDFTCIFLGRNHCSITCLLSALGLCTLAAYGRQQSIASI